MQSGNFALHSDSKKLTLTVPFFFQLAIICEILFKIAKIFKIFRNLLWLSQLKHPKKSKK